MPDSPVARCAACRKKVGLVALPCRCGGVYCAAHRTAHGCTFDYKAHGRQLLAQSNPQVSAAKVTPM